MECSDFFSTSNWMAFSTEPFCSLKRYKKFPFVKIRQKLKKLLKLPVGVCSNARLGLNRMLVSLV